MKQSIKPGFKCPYHDCCVGSVLYKRCESFVQLEFESDDHGRMEDIIIDCKLDLNIKRHLDIAEDIRFTASAPSTVGTGQQFAVTFTVNAAANNFTAPSFKGFSVLSGPNQSSSTSMQFVNGNMTQSVAYSFTYYLQAGNEGSYTITPAKVVVGGKTYESNSLNIKVVKAAQNTNPQNNNNNNTETRQQQNNQAAAHISDKDVYINTTVSK